MRIPESSRATLAVWLVAAVTFSAIGGNAQPGPQAPNYGGIDPKEVAAWERAGADFTWMDAWGERVRVSPGAPLPPGAVPGFWFVEYEMPRIAEFSALPAPAVPFGLRFNRALLAAPHLAALGALKQLRTFGCYACEIPDDAALAHLAGLAQLQGLDFNHLQVSDAGLNQLAGLKGLRWLQLRDVGVTDRGLEWLSELKQLEILRLPYTNVSAEGVGRLVELPRLRELSLQGKLQDLDLTDAFVDALARLQRLQTLSLIGTNLTDQGLKRLAGMTQLRELSFAGHVTDTGLKALAAFQQLRTLDLADSGISDAGLKELGALRQLEVLRLNRTKVTGSGFRSLASLPALRELRLGGCALTDAGLKELAGVTQLQSLGLANTRITDAGMKHLAALTELQALILGGSVTDAGLKELVPLKQLRTLDLGYIEITDAGLTDVAALTQLTELDLGGSITDAGLKKLTALKQLTSLTLAGTITDAGIRSLAGLPRLRDLWLPDDLARITVAGIIELTAALPSLRIDGLSGPAIRMQFAIEAAKSVAGPEARLAALEKVRPNARRSSGVDAAILSTLVANWPDRTTRIAEVLDRVVAAIPERAPPNVRLESTLKAVRPLAEKHVLLDRAEALVTAALVPGTNSGLRSDGLAVLGSIYLAQGDKVRARKALEEGVALVGNAASRSSAPLFATVAELEAQQGDDTGALDHYVTAAAVGTLTASQDAAMRALYQKQHASDAGLEQALNRRHRELLPNPVTPTRYVPSASRTSRVVLFELFTGSGCAPCVAADLALDGLLGRYPADALAAVAYHQNTPLPDPMVIANADRRVTDYHTGGTPTVRVDGGSLEDDGGGRRGGAPNTYALYVESIDKALKVPAGAAISVSAVGAGDQVTVRATVGGLPPAQNGLRLHILLVERELGYVGENGVRPHAMVVRAVAGADALGIPLRANGTTTHVFSLAAIRNDVETRLAAEITTRRKTGESAREFAAEGHAVTAIDTSQLVVVAFVQQSAAKAAAGQVLQAVQTDVVFRASLGRR
jgi:Leucine-rich repeat (LRR) protein